MAWRWTGFPRNSTDRDELLPLFSCGRRGTLCSVGGRSGAGPFGRGPLPGHVRSARHCPGENKVNLGGLGGVPPLEDGVVFGTGGIGIVCSTYGQRPAVVEHSVRAFPLGDGLARAICGTGVLHHPKNAVAPPVAAMADVVVKKYLRRADVVGTGRIERIVAVRHGVCRHCFVVGIWWLERRNSLFGGVWDGHSGAPYCLAGCGQAPSRRLDGPVEARERRPGRGHGTLVYSAGRRMGHPAGEPHRKVVARRNPPSNLGPRCFSLHASGRI